jgi:hypothetical protein
MSRVFPSAKNTEFLKMPTSSLTLPPCKKTTSINRPPTGRRRRLRRDMDITYIYIIFERWGKENAV